MKFIFSFLVLCFWFLAVPAQAEEFYVELGRTASEQEAQDAWKALYEKHQKILLDYDVYPNKILQPNGEFKFRVQAGPMLDKKEANNICRQLFRRQVQCFVIEGFNPKNNKTFEEAEVTSPPPEKPVVSAWDFLPWNESAPATKEPTPLLEADSQEVQVPLPEESEPQVEVAEAIPVPVRHRDMVMVGEPVEIASSDVIVTNVVEQADESTSGWLVVQPFLDEARAKAFWEELKQRSDINALGMSHRIIHPLVSHDIPKVILAVGTFSDENRAIAFCQTYISGEKYLECRFSKEPPQGREESEGGFFGRLFGNSMDEDEHSLHWVEVLSEDSYDKALEKWERIRTDHDDLLLDIRSQITTSLANPGVYVVRIGPLKSKTKANDLCYGLKSRKIGCKLVTL